MNASADHNPSDSRLTWAEVSEHPDPISLIHPDDRAAVLASHDRLPGQRLATTVHNSLFHGLSRRA